jgi:DnaK suppressor protein
MKKSIKQQMKQPVKQPEKKAVSAPVIEEKVNLEILKEALLAQRGRILNQASEFRAQQLCRTESLSDDADKVSNELLQTMSIRLHERDSSSLLQIDLALGRIASETYGQCELCEDEIGAARLRARPFATMCVCCMEEHEERRPSLF